jgi:hypothetical protein
MRDNSSFLSVSPVSALSSWPAMTTVGTLILPTSAGDVLLAGCFRPGKLRRRRAPQTIGDHLFAVFGAARFRRQHIIDGRFHRFTAGIGTRHHFPRLQRQGHRRRRRGRDQNEAGKACGPTRCHELRNLAAHGMADQHIALQVQLLDHALCIGREFLLDHNVGRRVGRSATTMVNRNGVEVRCKLVRNMLPGAG